MLSDPITDRAIFYWFMHKSVLLPLPNYHHFTLKQSLYCQVSGGSGLCKSWASPRCECVYLYEQDQGIPPSQ